MPRGNGGVIGPANIPTTSSAKGVWSLTEVALAVRQSIWPSPSVSADPYFEYTTLLLPGNGTNGAQNNTFLDGSTNNFTITRNGNTTQGTFSPFSQTGWGNYFGGSPSYLSGSGQLLGVGSNDFTVEAWVFIPTLSGVNNYPILGTSTTSNSPTGIYFAVKPDGSLVAAETWGTNLYTSTGITATAGTWNHVAVCRSGSTVRAFLNGVAASNTGTFSAGYNSTSFVIGRTWTTDAASSTYMIGTISNLRVISGQALYSGNFAPSTSPLTSTTVGSTGTGAATSITGTVTLLTCQDNRFKDNSPSTRTLTVNGSPTVVSFSPFNPTASWSAETYGGSGYFDGNVDYLATPSNSSFDLSTGDWTIDAWFYMNATGSYPQVWSIGNANSLSYALLCDQGTRRLDVLRNGGLSFTIATIDLSTWYHVAIVCQSGTVRAYLNGVQTGGTSTSLPPSGSVKFSVGGRNYSDIGAGSYWNGYISSVRVVKGTAVYTGNFTPPTAPITNAGSTSAASYPSTTNVNTSFASSATSLLLNFTNAGIYDATSKNDLETVGNAQISNAVTPQFGSTSIKFDGTGDYLINSSINSPLYQFGSGDFTVEMWIYPTTVSVVQYLIDFRDPASTTSAGIQWFISTSAKAGCYVGTTGIITASTTSISANTWTHVALVKNGTGSGNYKIYINGAADATTGTNTTSLTQGFLSIGTSGGQRNTASTDKFNGYIQDLRITLGVARYTTNFTPGPTAAFPTL